MQPDNYCMELMSVMINVTFYSMEMKYVMCRELNLNLGEIGPVEIELGITLLLVCGGCLGVDFFQQTLGQLTGVQSDWIAGLQLNHAVGIVFLVL